MGNSYFNEYVNRFNSDHLVHYFGRRDANGDLYVMSVYTSAREEPYSVHAIIEMENATNGDKQFGDMESQERVERVTVLMKRHDTLGEAVPLDTEALVLLPDGSSLSGGRWGVERIDNSDESLVQVTLVREKTKRYQPSRYLR